MMVHIRQSKGGKDRYVPLSACLLPYVDRYIKQYHPVNHLFFGSRVDTPLSRREFYSLFRLAVRASGIRKKDLLPVKYFHVVFTLPHELHPLLLEQRKAGFSALFKAAWQTIHAFSGGQRIQAGMVALLHTWGSNLTFHPHLHCIVPAGGLNTLGKWQEFANAHNRCPFLFPIKAMSKVFRAKYMAEISKEMQIPQNVRKELFAKPWVVFCKAPFSNRNIVLEYIGRYSHRVESISK